MDLFVVPAIGFDLLFAFVIVRLDRRDLVWINVTANSEWRCSRTGNRRRSESRRRLIVLRHSLHQGRTPEAVALPPHSLASIAISHQQAIPQSPIFQSPSQVR
jgi:hypothetical protein